MSHQETKFYPAGDRFILAEFGRSMDLETNFRAHGLVAAARQAGISGIVDMAPCFATVLVQYDHHEIGYRRLVEELADLDRAAAVGGDVELTSRLIYLPTMYLDPWTRDCIEDYRQKIAQRPFDPEYLAELNGLADPGAFCRMHAGTEWWVAAIGSWPGLPFTMALDPRCRLSGPKYNPPRTWTPKGSIGLGGSSTAVYSIESPGGYQIFGRTPVPIFDREQKLPAFKDNPVLLRSGDRLRFVPTGQEEFERIEALVEDGSYTHQIADYQTFSVENHKRWAASLPPEARF